MTEYFNNSKEKQVRKVLTKTLTHPIVLTIIFGLAIIFVLPFNFKKINFEPVDSNKLSKGTQIIMNDLDNDGNTEQIIISFNSSIDLLPVIQVQDLSGANYGQWNMKGNWLDIHNPIFGDYDSDGYTEIYVVTKSADSLFLNGIELLGDQGYFIKHRFVAISNINHHGSVDVSLIGGELYNQTLDQNKDLYFILSSGFSKYPRNIFKYNIEQDSLTISPYSGTGINSNISFSDIDSDNKIEIFGNVSALGNYTEYVPYKDSSCYLMVFDEDLKLKFEPIEFVGYPGNIIPYPFQQNDETFLLCLYLKWNVKTGKKFKLLLFSNRGDFLSELELPDDITLNGYSVLPLDFDGEIKYYLVNRKGQLFEISFPLELHKVRNNFSLSGVSFLERIYFDVDNNGENEVLLFGKDYQSILVLNKDLRLYTSIDIPNEPGYINRIYAFTNADSKRFLYVQSGNKFFSFECIKNPLNPWQYPIYLTIFLFLYLFFYYLNLVQKRLAHEKYENEKQVLKLQYNSIKNQVDPHFTINVLNTIAGLYTTKRQGEAEKNIVSFSRLMHQSLMNSDKISLSLKEELEFCRNFIEIQKTRFNDCFSYSIELDENVDPSLEIPRMLIHTFVENAIKHGLIPRQGGGHLSIMIINSIKSIQVTITDNGIGRSGSQEHNTHGTGKGLEIIDSILDLYKKLSGKRIKYTITDKDKDEQNTPGTIVRITIPE
ncbi:MAG: histidine kinase [Bacteroidales bacterium]|nr:histidine kinase [Bacteroidales bacterium]MCF8456938.1 histidine kinase [Bacteroidales bacterium]